MKRLSVRWRLTLWYGAVLTAIVIGFGGCVYVMMQRHLLVRTDFELDEELTELALETRLARNELDLKEQLEKRFYRHTIFDFQVSGPDGQPLFRSEHLASEILPSPNRDWRDSAVTISETRTIPVLDKIRIASRAAMGQNRQYLVQASMSLRPNEAELHALLITLLMAGSPAIAAALVGGYFLAWRSLSPVDQMATTAEQITGSELDARIEVANPDDELGHLARTFNAMLDRLQRAVEELRRFTADAAHELRTPLAALQSEAEVALRIPRSAEDYRRVIEVTLGEAKRLTQLADRLLVLSRHDCGLQPMRREETQLDALLHDVVDLLRVAADAKRIRLEVAPLEEWIVEGDDIQLSQLLFNLVDNAIKFTTAGGQVVIRGERCEAQVVLTISDTGMGIPSADLSHVFERFYRVDKSRNGRTGGAGLGLAISKAIVESHSGGITIESIVNAGTTVRVKLPLMPLTKVQPCD